MPSLMQRVTEFSPSKQGRALIRQVQARLTQIDEPGEEPDLAAQLDRAELERRLAAAFAGWLTANRRAALWLWAQGYIADELGKTATWTNRHITGGLRAMRAVFGGSPAAEQSRHETLRQPLVAQARRRRSPHTDR